MNSIKSMKHLVYVSLAIVAMVSCKKLPTETSLLNTYKVKAVYPETYSRINAEKAKVTIKNMVTLATIERITDENGIAEFTGFLPGNYQISVSRSLSPDEALELTGYSTDVLLNASKVNEIITKEGQQLTLQLQGGTVGGLVFKQVYYTNSRTASGTNYLQEQFYEIYNNSTDTLYADSLCLTDIQGNPGNSTSSKPTGFQDDKNYVYGRSVWMVPGNGKDYPIAPGESIIIAQTAIDHTEENATLNLGTGISDFEIYVESSNKDVDNPDVPNMLVVYPGSPGLYWLTYVFGASMVIFKHPDPYNLPALREPGVSSNTQYLQIPVENVIDGVDFLANAQAVAYKRLPVSIDAGFNYASGTYTGESMMRKVRSVTAGGRKILQDYNNSSQDFEVIKPALPKGWK